MAPPPTLPPSLLLMLMLLYWRIPLRLQLWSSRCLANCAAHVAKRSVLVPVCCAVAHVVAAFTASLPAKRQTGVQGTRWRAQPWPKRVRGQLQLNRQRLLTDTGFYLVEESWLALCLMWPVATAVRYSGIRITRTWWLRWAVQRGGRWYCWSFTLEPNRQAQCWLWDRAGLGAQHACDNSAFGTCLAAASIAAAKP